MPSVKFIRAMHALVDNTVYASQMPANGLAACFDELLWFNQNRGPGEAQDEIKTEMEKILTALGANDTGEIPCGNTIHQNAGKLLKGIYPEIIEKTTSDGTIFIKFNVFSKPEYQKKAIPEEAKYVWSALLYIEGFAYLIPAALKGNREKIFSAEEYFKSALILCPNEQYIRRALIEISEIDRAIVAYQNKRRRSFWFFRW